ncbi:MAG TPA: hypothetical protein VHZ29_01915 [Rhizomicrobium sp.]|jgi:hypothetical protein|nr:hypothetical protein [Rhizomicrobium sp.]
MRARVFAGAIFALAAATATAQAAAPQPVYRVDSVTAKILHGHLVVSVNGAVSSGGWSKPRLHLETPQKPESPEEVIEFQASPPADNTVVVQALLPITTTAVFPLPRYATVRVKVTSQTNTVTAPIQ